MAKEVDVVSMLYTRRLIPVFIFLMRDLNPLTPRSDQHLISPFNITTESHMDVMRIK